MVTNLKQKNLKIPHTKRTKFVSFDGSIELAIFEENEVIGFSVQVERYQEEFDSNFVR